MTDVYAFLADNWHWFFATGFATLGFLLVPYPGGDGATVAGDIRRWARARRHAACA